MADDLAAAQAFSSSRNCSSRLVDVRQPSSAFQMHDEPLRSFATPGPRVPAMAPSINAEAMGGGSSAGGQNNRHAVATLARKPLGQGKTRRIGRARIESPPRPQTDQQDRAGLQTRKVRKEP